MTIDGGATWRTDYQMSEQTLETLRDDLGEQCGESPSFEVVDISVLETPSGPVVAVAARQAGLLMRLPGGQWKRLDRDTLESIAAPPLGGRGRGALDVEEPPPRTGSRGRASAEALPCPSSTPVMITPNPHNGPPFAARQCPDGTYASAHE
jgi:hypothetical protein